jgi:hypothetical protein
MNSTFKKLGIFYLWFNGCQKTLLHTLNVKQTIIFAKAFKMWKGTWTLNIVNKKWQDSYINLQEVGTPSEQGDFIECRMKGKFRIKGIKSTNPIAVEMSWLWTEESSDTVTGTIHNIHERKNYIVRKSVNLSHQMHIIASNIDRVFLLIPYNNPPLLILLIDFSNGRGLWNRRF